MEEREDVAELVDVFEVEEEPVIVAVFNSEMLRRDDAV